MAGIDSGAAVTPVTGSSTTLGQALTSLEQQGWHVLSDVRQPGHHTSGVDAVLVGPGGVLVLESHKPTGRRHSVLSAVAAAVVALVPGDVRKHVQSIVCPPAERGDGDAVAVKPGVLAAFARSLPQVLAPEAAAAIALRLKESLTGPAVIDLWTAGQVLEWTKDARGQETVGNRAARRRVRRPEPVTGRRASRLRFGNLAGLFTRYGAAIAVVAALLVVLLGVGR